MSVKIIRKIDKKIENLELKIKKLEKLRFNVLNELSLKENKTIKGNNKYPYNTFIECECGDFLFTDGCMLHSAPPKMEVKCFTCGHHSYIKYKRVV